MFHRSERLLLRPIWPEDWQGVLAGIADEQVVRNLARAPWPYSEEEARRFTTLSIDPMHPRFLITLASDGQTVGCIGIDRVAENEQAVELGYWIARKHWGKGYATEAGVAAIGLARLLGHSTIFASHFLDNPASGKVLQKIGFERTGQVVERHSLGRGGKAPTAEFALHLAQQTGEWERQAA